MARPDFDIVVIGGGAGGLVVAAGGASLGARVALVEKHRMGGDCLWYGCVPSKTLIKSAHVANAMRHADRWALAPHDPKPDLARVMERVASVIRGIEPNDSPERFRSLGVDVVLGDGHFVAPDAFEVDGRRLTAKTFVLATGSRPAMPPIPGLAESGALTNETVFDLRENVPHLLVVGGGPIGSEMAQAFRRLGSEVTVVDVAPRILPREDTDTAGVVHRRMLEEGVRFHLMASIAKVEGARGDVRMTIRGKDGAEGVIAGTHVLVAAGRKVNIEGLGLDAAGVKVENGRIVTDARLRTTHPRVYVVGDVAGGYQFTHVAEHHAGIVLRQAIFHLFWTRPSTVVPWCTYTDPELARVGLSEDEARQQKIEHRVYRFAFDEIDRARAEGETEGFAKLVTDPKGRLLGAAIVGPHAGELIAECVLAVSKGMKAGDLSAAIHAYPTLVSINRRAADQRLKEGLTPSSKTWIKRIFGLRGV
ncbi:dihydrolipoamide dehydrogenase [Burkholderiales bacterium]|nr:dihydrolipoamide dehydrogenase [Burkholderiales bacterium]